MGHIIRATTFAVAAMASMTAATSAWAAAEATGSVSLSYSLIDVLPDDGLTPFVRAVSGPGDSTRARVVVGPQSSQLTYESQEDAQAFQPLSATMSNETGQTAALTSNTVFSVAGQSSGVGQYFQVEASSDLFGSEATGLELSPYSVLVIRATLDMHAAVSANPDCGGQACEDGASDVAEVNFDMRLDSSVYVNDSNFGNFGYNSQSANFGVYASNATWYAQVFNPDTGLYEDVLQPQQTTFNERRVFTFVVTNNTSQSLFSTLNLSLAGSGSTASIPSVTPPVDPGVPGIPEPSTWATMALGLVGMAGLVRRRRQCQA